jgi:hypothetical protein
VSAGTGVLSVGDGAKAERDEVGDERVAEDLPADRGAPSLGALGQAVRHRLEK